MDIGRHRTAVTALAAGLGLAAALGCAGKTKYTVPEIVSVTPTTAQAGDTVVIAGTSFQGANAVSIGGARAYDFSLINGQEIVAKVPDDACTGAIAVQNPGGLRTSTFLLTVQPVITGVSPASAAQGDTVTVTGTGFYGTTAVAIGGASSVFTYYDPNTLKVKVGANAVSGILTVTASGLTATWPFTAAALASVTPAQAQAGTTVVISGSDLTGATAVGFGGVPSASFSTISDTQISAVLPANAQTGPITVQVPGGLLTSGFTLTVIPVVASLVPATGPVGTTVTVSGSGFIGTTAVAIGGDSTGSTTFTVGDANTLTVVVGSGAATGPLAVTASGLTATGPVFTVTP